MKKLLSPDTVQEKEKIPENKIMYTARIFVLIPEKNGYKTLILTKDLGNNKERYETAGGKIDTMCTHLKGNENQEYNPSLFSENKSGKRILTEGSHHIVRQGAVSEVYEEIGVKINEEDLIHLAYTERQLVDSEGIPSGGQHCTHLCDDCTF